MVGGSFAASSVLSICRERARDGSLLPTNCSPFGFHILAPSVPFMRCAETLYQEISLLAPNVSANNAIVMSRRDTGGRHCFTRYALLHCSGKG